MGQYNSQYESYYSSIVNKRNTPGHFRGVSDKKPKGSWMARRLMQELCGVLVLLIFVVFCKFVVTPKTTAAYNYSKNIVNSNYDYKNIINRIKTIDVNKSLEDRVIDFIDNVRTKFTGGETIKEKIKEKFSLPVNGNIIDEEGEGITIQPVKDTNVMASFDGRVKECGLDKDLGKYVLIDHGEGIETVYSNLKEIIVKENDLIKKGDIIAESEGTDSGDYINFQVLFMGQNKDLENSIGYIN